MSTIGRYELVGRIAIGNRRELFLGREPSGKPVAIKRIPPGAGRGTSARHPNLVELFELVQNGDELYLVEEYLEGENLAGLVRRLIKRRERISYALSAHMMAEVCDGIHAAHQAGELHRAVSPENVFITYGGDIKLLDLGIAQLEADSPYRSPEQSLDRPLGRQSDVYSAGLVLYELTTLRRAFASGEVVGAPIPPPSMQVREYPDALDLVCMRALDPEPANRYRSAGDMRDALLATARQLGLEPDPSQALASKLMRLFGDRIATKRELLDRVRVGLPLGDLVPAEADEDVDVPVVVAHAQPPPLQPARPSTRTIVVGDAPPPPANPMRHSLAQPVAAPLPAASGFRWGVLILFVLAIALGGATGWYLRSYGLPDLPF
ncbi:MAG TPA: serine/threonine-protein kinase [Kofleriaceae bacterium]|jgi:serine/threonine-protein kinase